MVDLNANLAAVRDRMAHALATAGRSAGSVRLIAVTKTQPPDVVAAAIAGGLTDLGENYIDEAQAKMSAFASAAAIRWHMIGHIQSRKARPAVAAGFALIHSVDSLRVAQKLSAAALAAGRPQPVLLECNVSGEPNKAGFTTATPEAIDASLPEITQVAALPGLSVRGLMTMAPVVAHPAEARPVFARLRALRDLLAALVPAASWTELSMGMTDDFEAAIAEGATLIRIGRAIFGARA